MAGGSPVRQIREKTMDEETNPMQIGFDTLPEAIHRLYPGLGGLFYRTALPYALGGDDPLGGQGPGWACDPGDPIGQAHF